MARKASSPATTRQKRDAACGAARVIDEDIPPTEEKRDRTRKFAIRAGISSNLYFTIICPRTFAIASYLSTNEIAHSWSALNGSNVGVDPKTHFVVGYDALPYAIRGDKEATCSSLIY